MFSQTSILFGKIKALKKATKQLILTNESTIQADFTTKIMLNGECFSVSPESVSIDPSEPMTINVSAALDDIINFRAKIIFTFEYLNPISIDVSATGTGSTIVPSIPMTNLNMGCIFTEQTSHSSVSKFSICAIVYNPKFSGKTTVSNSVSKFLGNVPIIVLEDIWKDIMKNPEATQADYVSTFSEVISSHNVRMDSLLMDLMNFICIA